MYVCMYVYIYIYIYIYKAQRQREIASRRGQSLTVTPSYSRFQSLEHGTKQ